MVFIVSNIITILTCPLRRSASRRTPVNALAAGLCGVLSLSSCFSQNPPAEHVCVVSKVVLEVACREAWTEWRIARRGETLSSGDRVRTGEKSAAIIKFKDDSFVRVHERSELTLTGTPEGSSFSRFVNLEHGAVGFDVQKQRSDEEFRFTSPTSIASIRGTMGAFVADAVSDTLTVVEGAVVLTNALSFENVEVQAGCTGISNPNGAMSVRMATPDELTVARDAAREDKETMQVVSRKGLNCGLDVAGLYAPNPDPGLARSKLMPVTTTGVSYSYSSHYINVAGGLHVHRQDLNGPECTTDRPE